MNLDQMLGLAAIIVVPICAMMGFMWKHVLSELKEANNKLSDLDKRVTIIEMIFNKLNWRLEVPISSDEKREQK